MRWHWRLPRTPGQGTLVSLDGLSQSLNANTEYWLQLTPGTNGTSLLWDYAANGTATGINVGSQNYGNDGYGFGNDSTGGYIFSAIASDNSNPNPNGTPEPATFALLGGGIALVGLLRRKVRVS